MPTLAIFGISILMCFVAFGLFSSVHLWPWLRARPSADALRILLVPHTFRFVGMSFLVPGVVGPSVPSAFAVPAAYGDLIACGLAIASTVALSSQASWALGLVWVFNIWGTCDLLLAFYHGLTTGLDAGTLGAAFYIPTAIVPALLVLHVLIFRVLLAPRRRAEAAG